MNTKPITVIVETITSSRDVNGNCYHFARFYNPAKGRNDSVVMEVWGESNARYIARTLAGDDQECVLSFQSVLAKRDWQGARKHANVTLCEGTPEAKLALAGLFSEVSLVK